jgi:transposase InsO family protein
MATGERRVWRLCSQAGLWASFVKKPRSSKKPGPPVHGDNARIESFHSLLQNNVLDSKKWVSQEELRIAIVHRIEKTYHRRRRKQSLGKMTPVEYEAAHEVLDKELLVA